MNPDQLRKEWNEFTELDTKNPEGLSFVIMPEDEKTIADWWLSKLASARAEDNLRLAKELAKLKHGLGEGDGYLIDRGYNMAIDDVLVCLQALLPNPKEE